MRMIRAKAVRIDDEIIRDNFNWRVTRIMRSDKSVIIECETIVRGVVSQRNFIYRNGELVTVTADN